MAEENSYIGKEVGNYRITRTIASGGFGTVYEARHITLAKRVVAVKLLHTFLGSASDREKFIQEAQLLSELEHPHILPVLDVGFQDKQPYIIMKYAEGGSLKDRLRQHFGQPLPLAEAITILTQIGQALHYAHQHMIVHRDLKPENILFDARGEALLADFGIAVMLPQARTGQIGQEGTPAYMAPEQFEGKASVKSDQYVLGCIAYELVTGQKPFEVDGVPLEAIWYQHTKVAPTPTRQLNPAIPEELEQAILKAMEKQREARYANIATFCAAIENSLRTTRRLEQVAQTPEELNKNVPLVADEQAPAEHNPISSSLVEAVANTPPSLYADDPLPANDADDENWEDYISLTPPRVPVVKNPLNSAISAQHDTQPPAMPVNQSSLEDDLEDSNSLSQSGFNKNSGSLSIPLVVPAGISRQRPRDVRRLSMLLLAALVLCSLLLCGGLAFAAPDILPTPIRNYVTSVFGGVASGATVNITLKSAKELNTYVITGVATGTADSTRRQVPARQLTYTTPTTQKTVNSTGKVNIATTQATGTLTFYNGNGTDYSITAHMVFTDTNGVQVENNGQVDVPAGSSQNGYGRITVPRLPSRVVQPETLEILISIICNVAAQVQCMSAMERSPVGKMRSNIQRFNRVILMRLLIR